MFTKSEMKSDNSFVIIDYFSLRIGNDDWAAIMEDLHTGSDGYSNPDSCIYNGNSYVYVFSCNIEMECDDEGEEGRMYWDHGVHVITAFTEIVQI